MKRFNGLLVAGLMVLPALLAGGQSNSVPGTPVSITITHEGHIKAPLQQSDLKVSQGKDERPVASLDFAGQKGGPMQVLILVDDSARTSFGIQLQPLKQFVTSLPANADVAIGYMRNGTNQMVSEFTSDHAAAAKAIRIPLGAGGADVSPYDSLSEAVKNWPQKQGARKEIIMISSGIEGLGGGFTPDNPYVNAGIESAQKAGAVVYAIYNPSVGSGRSFWRGTWGQNFLSQLADETGGEAYNINMGTPVSIAPFLTKIAQQFKQQYVLQFEAKPEKKAGMQYIKVALREKDGEISAAKRVYVKAGV